MAVPEPKQAALPTEHLTTEEQELGERLLAEGLRLKQERIPFDTVREAVLRALEPQER